MGAGGRQADFRALPDQMALGGGADYRRRTANIKPCCCCRRRGRRCRCRCWCCVFCRVCARQGEVHFDTAIAAIGQTNTIAWQIRCIRLGGGKKVAGGALQLSTTLFFFPGVGGRSNGSRRFKFSAITSSIFPRQSLWLHIIWVISLHFYAADVSPCQRPKPPSPTTSTAPPPLDKARRRTLSLLFHASLPAFSPFLPLCPPPPPIPGVSWDAVPRPKPAGGKTYFNRCRWSDTDVEVEERGDKRQLVVLYFLLRSARWLTHPPRWTRILEARLEGRHWDTNGRWLIGSWGKWLLWCWYHHRCNVIEMARTHNHIPLSFRHLVGG